jgi:hypothetical protein
MKTLIALFWESTRTVRFITMIVSMLGAVGIFLRNTSPPTGDVHLLLTKSPWWAWSGALLVVAVNRWWCLWYGRRCTDVPALIVGTLAMLVWMMLLTSAAVASDFGLALMMLTCVFCEFWLLARVFAEKYFK